MAPLLNAKELKEQASIVDLLSRLGFEPVKKYGKEHMYRSMLRDNDRTPSFSVDDRVGAWFDHGTGKGGNIIDLGLAFWPGIGFNEVLAKLQGPGDMPPSVRMDRDRRPRLPVKVRNYAVDTVKPLGTHIAITNYLKERGIFEAAKSRMSEVYYHVLDEQGEQKKFFAAGWKNEAGGWEVRNKYFKGCLGTKDITLVNADPKKAAIFEGYINYLSWLTGNREDGRSVIILNSLSLLNRGVEQAKRFSDLDIYFDRDASGSHAAREFVKALPYATDRSTVFEGFNDYNDKLVASLKTPVVNDPFERGNGNSRTHR